MTVAWHYVAHRFVFSDPPRSDPRLRDWVDGVIHLNEISDMGIGWHVVAIEITLILLIGAAVIATLLLKKRLPTR